MISAIVGVVCFLVGVGVVFVLSKVNKQKNEKLARVEADRILNKAKSEASKIERDSKKKAKDTENRIRQNAEQEINNKKKEVSNLERKVKEKESKLDKDYKAKLEVIEKRQQELNQKDQKLNIVKEKISKKEESIETRVEELKEKLVSVANMSKEEAKQELVQSLEEEAKIDASKRIIVLEDNAKAEAEKKAKRIISMAIARYAGEYASERTVSVVALPSDEMKGKIIGREGRNIRALEAMCGVDLIIDDTPEAVVVSGFDPVRREVARRGLERLMEDGRIHPARIEEVINKVKKELFKSIHEDGDKACLELGIHGVNKEIVKLLGSLRYRTSYTQNNYTHSLEVGFLAGMMASELGQDVKAARRAGLLHDLGKALDHSIEGSHAVIGAEFAKRYGEREKVCHAIRSHHEDEKPRTSLAYLVQAADALSSARPGARRSMMETYVQRLTDLESIGNSFDGVERTFAIQAGREIRVVVDASKITDEQALMLSRDIAKKIERELSYPGQVKVAVVRETRAIEHAR